MIMVILNFIAAHYIEMLAIAGTLNVAAFAVAKLTPNKTDDKWVAKVQKVLDFFALNLPTKQPEDS